MSLQIVQSAKYQPGSTGNTIVLTLGSAPIEGNILLAFTAYSQYLASRTCTGPDETWTKLEDASSGYDSLSVWWKTVPESAASTYTWNISGSNEWRSGVIYEISGANGIAGSEIATGTTKATITPTFLHCLVLAAVAYDSGNYSSIESGWTVDQSAVPSYHPTHAAHRDDLTSDTSTPISANWSPNNRVNAIVLVSQAQDHYIQGSLTAQLNIAGHVCNYPVQGSLGVTSTISGNTKVYKRTRFYLPNDPGNNPVSPAYGSEWDAQANGLTRYPCYTEKINSSFTNFSTSLNSATVLMAQFVSPKLAAQTITGAIRGVIRAYENSVGYNACPMVIIKVVSEDGQTVRGTLASYIPSQIENEFVEGSGNMASCYFPPEINITPITCQENDRIVIELGRKIFSGYYAVLGINLGDNSETDLPYNNAETSAYCPWIEFTGGLLLLGQKLVEGHVTAQSSLTGASNVSQAAIQAAGLIGAQSFMSAPAGIVKSAMGTLTAISSTSSTAKATRNFQVVLESQAALTGLLHRSLSPSGSVVGQAAINGSASMSSSRIVASLDGQSALSGSAKLLVGISAIIEGSFALSGITSLQVLVGIVVGQSIIEATAKVLRKASGLINASSVLSVVGCVTFAVNGASLNFRMGLMPDVSIDIEPCANLIDLLTVDIVMEIESCAFFIDLLSTDIFIAN